MKATLTQSHYRAGISFAIWASARLALFGSVALSLALSSFGQSDQSNERFVYGDVNDTGNLSFSIPLFSYNGRGLDLPVALSYSSDVWRIEHLGKVNRAIPPYPGTIKQSVTEATYAKNSIAGWRSSLELPTIEWPKDDVKYDHQGKQGLGAGTCTFWIREVYIHMPGGVTHTLRKFDQPSNVSPSGIDRSGTFYSIDGSRIRFDANGSEDSGTIYLPDGTTYVLSHPVSTVTDRHGNQLSYNDGSKVWTDSLGRSILNPLSNVPSENDDVEYELPGLGSVNGGVQRYVFKWRKLADSLTPDASGNPPALRVVGSEFLPYPTSAPGGTNFPESQGSQYQPLFKSSFVHFESGNGPLVGTLIVGKAQPGNTPFNPMVLAEVVLPDQTSYQFSYNIYGEIDKIVYPTMAYDRYDYYGPPPGNGPPEEFQAEDPQPYVQALRSISSRKQGSDHSGDEIREWKYAFSKDLDGASSSSVIAPDKTRTVTQNYGPGAKSTAYTGHPSSPTPIQIYPFGFRDARLGMPMVKKFYSSSSDGLSGELLRQEVFQYDQTTTSYSIACDQSPGQGPNIDTSRMQPLTRTPRLARKTEFIFEGGGSALALSNTYGYDLTKQFETGIDQTSVSNYHYVVVDEQVAKDTDTESELAQIPLGSFAKRTKTAFHASETYRTANILALPAVVEVFDSSDINVVSRSEMVYDECPTYCTSAGKALPTSMKTWDSTKGLDPSHPNNQLVTHAKFDQWGNRIQAIDAEGFVTTTVYDSTYQAFPIQVISPVPDPSGVRGSNTAFSTTTTYDTPQPNKPPLGLVITTTDANGIETRMEYNDPLLRPTRMSTHQNGQQVGGATETYYGVGSSDTTRWVRVRTQIDSDKWTEAVSNYDGLGRTVFSKKIDQNGNIGTKTEYDLMGRVLRSSNPYRLDASDNPATGETLHWTTPEYDDLSRTKKVISPDTDDIQISYGLSTSSVIGTTKTIVDQAGRERTGITDALGNMIRVYEGQVASNQFTDYVFDTLGNLRKTTQGEQNRYFMYDSLGRVLFAKQPEQGTNTAFVATDPITANASWSAKYTYDNNGNILTTTDARNVSITGAYDQLNRLTTRDYSDTTPDVGFYYDGKYLDAADNPQTATGGVKGKTTGVKSSVSRSNNIAFDGMGRLLTSQQITNGQTYNFSYTYNLSGALIEETYPSGRVVKNTLNSDGELSQVQSGKCLDTALGTSGTCTNRAGFFSYADAFTYNSAGAVTKMQLGNGRWETASYNERQQITRIGLGITSNDQNLLTLEFKYNTTGQADNNGSMREQKIIVPSVGTNPGFTATQTYTYDSLNRIQSATETINSTQTWKQTFSIDRYGNRRFDAANTTTLGSCAASVCNPEINTSDNRLKKDQAGGSSVDYDFDANGALIKNFNGERFGYDAESHQTEYFSASNQTVTPDATYEYDGEGRRVKKTAGTEVTVFVYDASGKLAAEYSTTVVTQAQAKVGYFTTDHLGSPRIVTDQNGAVISRKDFTAFGETVTSAQRVGGQNGNGYDPPNVRQDYTGYQKDIESSLEFAQARYYNAGHGRFTSVDPLTASATIRNPQTFNRYSYVLNSPYEFTDPLGLAPCSRYGGRCVQVGGGDWFSSSYEGTVPNFAATSQKSTINVSGLFRNLEEQSRTNLEKRLPGVFGGPGTGMSPSEEFMVRNLGRPGGYFANPNDGNTYDAAMNYPRPGASRNDPENHYYPPAGGADNGFYIPEGGEYQFSFERHGDVSGEKFMVPVIYFKRLGGKRDFSIAIFHLINQNLAKPKNGPWKIGEVGPGAAGAYMTLTRAENGRIFYTPAGYHLHIEVYRGKINTIRKLFTASGKSIKPHTNFNDVSN